MLWMVIPKTTVLGGIYDGTEKSSVTAVTALLSASVWLSAALGDLHWARVWPPQWQAAQFIADNQQNRAQITFLPVAASWYLTCFVAADPRGYGWARLSAAVGCPPSFPAGAAKHLSSCHPNGFLTTDTEATSKLSLLLPLLFLTSDFTKPTSATFASSRAPDDSWHCWLPNSL